MLVSVEQIRIMYLHSKMRRSQNQIKLTYSFLQNKYRGLFLNFARLNLSMILLDFLKNLVKISFSSVEYELFFATYEVILLLFYATSLLSLCLLILLFLELKKKFKMVFIPLNFLRNSFILFFQLMEWVLYLLIIANFLINLKFMELLVFPLDWAQELCV